jgi:hypothetical protein
MPSDPRTGPEQLLSMQERVDESQAVLDRQASTHAASDQSLAGSRDHLADMHRRVAQDGTP